MKVRSPSSITSSCCNWYPPTGTSKKRAFHLLGLSQECLLVNSQWLSTTNGLTQGVILSHWLRALTPSDVFCNCTGDFIQNELVEEFVHKCRPTGGALLEEASDSQEKSELKWKSRTDEPGKTMSWPANLNVTRTPYASASTILSILSFQVPRLPWSSGTVHNSDRSRIVITVRLPFSTEWIRPRGCIREWREGDGLHGPEASRRNPSSSIDKTSPFGSASGSETLRRFPWAKTETINW